jgi:hypothetical protein
MAPQNTEELVYPFVLSGELSIDPEGRIWRHGARRWDRWTQATKFIPCKPRRAEKDSGEYLQVRVMVNGKRANALAHRLVWRHFNGPIPEGMTVNHQDGLKKRNPPGNLELATYSEQQVHSIRVLGHDPMPNLGSHGLSPAERPIRVRTAQGRFTRTG